MLQLIDLKKRFGDVVALDGAGFTVDRGRILGFLGPNGAGKTTAMRVVFGLVNPDSGSVRGTAAPWIRPTGCVSGTCPRNVACIRR